MLHFAEAIYARNLEKRKRRFLRAAQRIEDCAVVSVGNISLGGTGKTPAVQFIVRTLQSRGARVAVVARGYRGKLSDRGAVVSNGEKILLDARDCGDEPLLHARALPGVIVVIGRDRIAAAKRAVEIGADVVVLDDAFSYWSLARDFDVVLLDARRPFDNGHLLPRGRLRESPQELKRADAILLTRCDLADENQLMQSRESIARLSGAPLWETRHAPVSLICKNGKTTSLEDLRGARLGAVSALADNANFAASLRVLGAEVVAHAARRDHHFWSAAELQRAVAQAKANGANCVVTTEKDIVKFPACEFDLPIFALRIQLQFLAGEDEFDFLLHQKVRRNSGVLS